MRELLALLEMLFVQPHIAELTLIFVDGVDEEGDEADEY